MKITTSQTYISSDERNEIIQNLKELTFNSNYIVTDRDTDSFIRPSKVFFKAFQAAFFWGTLYILCLLGVSFILKSAYGINYDTLLFHYIFIPVFGIFTTKYWNEHSFYFEFWKQCSAQYNNLYEDFFSDDNKLILHWYRRINLAFDLYDMELTDHQSFQSFYNKTLYTAYAINHAEKKHDNFNMSKIETLEELKSFQNKLNKINGIIKE